jgi:ABC-type branched-subunit amino acid transport system substrate-binding protein
VTHRARALLTAACASSALACVEHPEALAPIKLGVLYPASGTLTQGAERSSAAVLAAEQVNAGGGLFDGRALELILLDSETDPAVAKEQAERLVDEGVVGVIGPETSGESAQVIPVLEKASIPMISCCATSALLTEGNQPNEGFFFRTTPSDELQGKALAYLARKGVTPPAAGDASANPCPQTAFLYRDDTYGQGFEAVFTSEYEGKAVEGAVNPGAILVSQPYDPNADQAGLAAAAQTFVDEMAAVMPDGAAQPVTCVVVISFDTDGGEVVLRVDEGLQDLIAARGAPFALPYHFLVADGANSSVFATAVGAIGERLIGTVPYHGTGEAYDQFRKAFQARYESDDEPIAFTSQSFDAAFLLSLAVAKARSEDGKKIRDALFDISGASGGDKMEGKFFGEIAARLLDGDDIDYAGPSGELTFDAFGDVVGDYVLWQVAPDDADGYSIFERQPLPASEFNALE